MKACNFCLQMQEVLYSGKEVNRAKMDYLVKELEKVITQLEGRNEEEVEKKPMNKVLNEVKKIEQTTREVTAEPQKMLKVITKSTEEVKPKKEISEEKKHHKNIASLDDIDRIKSKLKTMGRLSSSEIHGLI